MHWSQIKPAQPLLAELGQRRMIEPGVVLVRPDQHVCWRANAQTDSDQAESLFMRVLGWRSAGAPKQRAAIAS